MTQMTAIREPIAELDPEFSDPTATPTAWSDARRILETAQTYWLSTVRVDGRPHVTPVAGVWVDDAVHVTTGDGEQKRRNIAGNAHCVLTTGCNGFEGGEGHLRLRDVTVSVVRCYRLQPRKAFGFKKDDPFGQTRWRFDQG